MPENNTASFVMQIGFHFSGVKQPEGEEDQSTSSSTDVRNVWSKDSTPLCDFMSFTGTD
jgi:hypothetical protein